MQEPHVFEYAVIRVVPRVEREEFLNVGVVLYCARQKFLQVRLFLDEDRLRAFSAQLDVAAVRDNLQAFEQICLGSSSSPIARLDLAARFRWLTATRSTVVQASKVHPGLCQSPAVHTLDRLHTQLVL